MADEGRRSVGIAKEQLTTTIAIPGSIGKPFGGALGQSPKLEKPIILRNVYSWIVRNWPDSPFLMHILGDGAGTAPVFPGEGETQLEKGTGFESRLHELQVQTV